MTSLHLAADSGNFLVIELLLAAGAQLETKNKLNGGSLSSMLISGMTPLHCCANKGHIAVVEQLLAAKANVDAETDLGQTALHSAAATGQVLVLEALLAAGALLDAKDKDGSSLKMSPKSFPTPILSLHGFPI
eukprot:Skav211871  [mRNA]  locus=scaffold1431:213842:214907:- [translate_table: standard]